MGNNRLAMMMCAQNEETIIAANLAYHRALGVEHFYIILDRSTDKTKEIIADMPDVDIIETDRTDFEMISEFQCHWTAKIMQQASNDSYEWLLHVDADEFAVFSGCTPYRFKYKSDNPIAAGHFKQIEYALTDQEDFLRLRSIEAMPRQSSQIQSFLDLTHFCLSTASYKRKVLDPENNDIIKIDGFSGHTIGKTIVRTSADVIPDQGPHNFIRSNGDKAKTRTVGFHFHYATISPSQWQKKFLTFANDPQHWGKTPFEEARRVWVKCAKQFTEEEAIEYYDKWVAPAIKDFWWAKLRGHVRKITYVNDVLKFDRSLQLR